MSKSRLATTALLSILPLPALAACDVTLSPWADIQSALNSSSFLSICLNPGVYQLSRQLIIPPNKSLEGLGNSRDDVALISSADRVISMGNNTMLKGLRIQNAVGTTPGFGVLSYYNSDVLLWGLRIVGMNISIGINGSSDVHVWDTFMSMNGRNNRIADPNLWITDAQDVEILWGEALGRGNGPGGDGEIAAYNSTAVEIYGTYVTNSGASAIYFVNCDYCSIENTTITNANEWGLDVVSGSDNFTAKNNYISRSRYGGSVFDGVNNLNGKYISNTFMYNNTSGYNRYCNGINYSGSRYSFTAVGNTGTGQLLCKPW